MLKKTQMGAISNAVLDTFVSRVLGYSLTAGNFQTITSNLPQRIALLGEANNANQGTLDTNPFTLLNLKQAGDRYGYGSPIYNAARILLPQTGGGVSGIPIVVYPQTEAGGAVAKALDVTPTGTATGNGTITLVINGRRGLDGVFFDVNIVSGDTPTIIVQKMIDAVNIVLGSTVIGTNSVATVARFTAKWRGLTSNDINITVDTNNTSLGVTFAVTQFAAGTGTPTIAAALALFGSQWNTIVLNPYGTDTSTMTALEAFNGRPDATSPTGRYGALVWKPFIAITGSIAADPSAITDARLNDLTIAIAPAPLSKGLPLEAAANMTVLFANVAQNNPELDVAGKAYPDMPAPTSIGVMADYATRSSFVSKGCSTVDLVGGQYVVQDFVTTYHKIGETPPQYRYPRILNIDFNVKYGVLILEEINVVDHFIAKDDAIVSAQKVVKPKMWKSVLNKYALDLEARGLIVDAQFMQDSLVVGLSTTNPDRLETYFKYKRSGFARVVSTTAEAGFNFGTL